MRTFEIKEFLRSIRFVVVFVWLPFLVFLSKNVSKTLKGEVSFSKKDSILLSFARSFQAEVEATAGADSSIFSKIFGGIKTFFLVVGQGIGKGISSTVWFLGKAISLPFTATIALFSRKADTKSDKGSTGADSRSNE